MATLAFMSVALDPFGGLPGVFTYSDARRLGITDRRLYAARDSGEVEMLGRGLYRRSSLTGDHDLLEIAARAPEATLCLGTALAHHDLTDAIPQVIDVATSKDPNRQSRRSNGGCDAEGLNRRRCWPWPSPSALVLRSPSAKPWRSCYE